MVNHRMTRGEANAVQTLVIEYHNFYRAWERGEVRKAVEAARRIRNVADVARYCGISISEITSIANKADAAHFA